MMIFTDYKVSIMYFPLRCSPINFLSLLIMLIGLSHNSSASHRNTQSVTLQKREVELVLDTLIDLGITKDDFNKITYCCFDNRMLIYLPYEGDSLCFVEVELTTHSISKLYINMVGIEPGFEMTSPVMMDIAMDKNTVVLLANRGIIVLERVQMQKTLRYLYSAPLPAPYSRVGIYGGVAMLGYCYNHHPESAKTTTQLSIFDIRRRTVLHSISPAFTAIHLTHFTPHQWIDFSGCYILFSESALYRTTIYDTSLRVVAVLSRKPSEWVPIDTLSIAKIAKQQSPTSVKSVLPQISTLINNSISSTIKTVAFIDSTTIMVGYTPSDPKKKQLFNLTYDIWKRSSTNPSSWVCSNAEIQTLCKARKDTCHKYNFTNFMQFAKSSTNDRESIYCIMATPDTACLYAPGQSYQELDKRSEVYFSKDNPPRYTLFKYQWKKSQ